MERENQMERERLGSRLGFILLSAGCAIGCGNVWKFPWMCGQYGGGGFVLIYVLCLLLLGLPVMTMEFAVGRAAQASPLHMYQKLERKGQKWHIHGYVAFFGNIALMAFYTVVTGWIVYYFVKFLTGQTENLGFVAMITNPGVNVTYLAVTVIVAFTILCFNLQGGLERISKYMMTLLLVLMVVLAVHSATLSGAAEGLKFYLVPDFSKITGTVIVGAMNQAFFTLSVGMGSMAIFGSYIGKERSLTGEALRICGLDTAVALMAGLIIFPACFTFNGGVTADAGTVGASFLFTTLSSIFNNMPGGRVFGTLFFLFMIFASFSTVIAVFENIMSFWLEETKLKRKKVALINIFLVLVLSLPAVLGFNVLSNVSLGSKVILDIEDFIISNNVLPLGSMVYVLFCSLKTGWGWDNFIKEANTGEKGFRFPSWMRLYFKYAIPVIILVVWASGVISWIQSI